MLVLRGQTTKETSKLKPSPTKSKETRSDIRDTFPVIEYSSESLLESEKRRSEKYDKGGRILFPDMLGDNEGFSAIDWERGLTALPIDKSELVILGKVIDAKAHLSANKHTVYSEFKIEIEKIFKNSSLQGFENEKCVIAERVGGIVRYPSGYKLWYRVAGQQMPSVNHRYVFFLTNNFSLYGHYKEDFYLLTAYELRDGKVIPLDNPGDSHPIVSTYKGKDESVLLNDLKNVLKTQ